MPVSYTNCRDQIYFLHEGKTKTGKLRYWASQKAEGDLLESIPEGYEIYERPGGMVFVRKIQKTPILPHELQCVQEQLASLNAKEYDFFISIFGTNVRALSAGQQAIIERSRTRYQAEVQRNEIIVYEVSCQGKSIMKFVLHNKETREYLAYRWYFRGSEGWMSIGSRGQLQDLACEYCPALGTDEFFELW